MLIAKWGYWIGPPELTHHPGNKHATRTGGRDTGNREKISNIDDFYPEEKTIIVSSEHLTPFTAKVRKETSREHFATAKDRSCGTVSEED